MRTAQSARINATYIFILSLSFLYFLTSLLKVLFDQNSVVIYPKFNDNFNNHDNECENRSERMSIIVCSITQVQDLFVQNRQTRSPSQYSSSPLYI
jgi:hypothetical protein